MTKRKGAFGGAKTLIAAMAMGIAAVAAPQQSAAQTDESVGAKKDWSIFKQGSAADRQCWIVSQPLTKTAERAGKPVSVNRGDVFLMVAIRPGARVKNEVSMLAGYPFRADSSATMRVGSEKFELFTSGENAWTDSPEADDKLVAAMRKGTTAVVMGTSSRGTQTTDTFSLSGFTAALAEARALCK